MCVEWGDCMHVCKHGHSIEYDNGAVVVQMCSASLYLCAACHCLPLLLVDCSRTVDDVHIGWYASSTGRQTICRLYVVGWAYSMLLATAFTDPQRRAS